MTMTKCSNCQHDCHCDKECPECKEGPYTMSNNVCVKCECSDDKEM